MADLIWLLNNYKLVSQKLKDDMYGYQDVRGKIIEKELEPSVTGKNIQNLRIESSVGLHTLRIGLGEMTGAGESDLVIHMAKESLRALQLTPLRVGKDSKRGIVLNFRSGLGIEPYGHIDSKAYDEFKLGLADFERGISKKTIESMGKIVSELEYSQISCAFPSWYYEDWVQIHFKNRELLLRVDPRCLYGIGVGNINKSTINFGLKEDTIFHWECWMNQSIGRYYRGGGSRCSYGEWRKAKVKIEKVKDEKQ